MFLEKQKQKDINKEKVDDHMASPFWILGHIEILAVVFVEGITNICDSQNQC